MERKILKPRQILVPGEYELGNESILNIYFRICNRGYSEDLPPVIVAHNSLGNRGENFLTVSDNNRIRIGAYQDQVQRYIDNGTEYFLLDGNHRTVACALTHQPISVLELATDDDLEEIKRMVKTGELFDWKHESNSLRELVEEFEYSCERSLDQMMTVEERVKQLISNRDVPRYMRERYEQCR